MSCLLTGDPFLSSELSMGSTCLWFKLWTLGWREGDLEWESLSDQDGIELNQWDVSVSRRNCRPTITVTFTCSCIYACVCVSFKKKQNHICTIFHLAFLFYLKHFWLYNILWTYFCISSYNAISFSEGSIVFHCVEVHKFINLSTMEGYLGFFFPLQIFVVIDNATFNILTYIMFCRYSEAHFFTF